MKTVFTKMAAIASLAILFAGCSGTFGLVGDAYKTSDYGPPSQGISEVAEAGLLTAGEWNDLSNWDFWGSLLNNKEFQVYESFWNMYTYNRVAVKVSYPGGEPAIGVKVLLSKDNEEIWQAVTDNIGEAECWVSYFQKDSTVINDPDSWADFKISLNGEAREAVPIFSKRGEPAALNNYTITSSTTPEASADIAFIVDATGSMQDEIEFLKEDLMSILRRVKDSTNLILRTGTVFYRDQGDSYLTKHSAFTEDISTTVKFISNQKAAGGGDYEEAVHSALEASLQDLSWKENGRARLAFLVFDAPAHQNQEGVLASLQASTIQYAKKGIKLIPVLASGGSKEAEFLGRLMAIATNGTYVFLTDDSGIGGDHIEASVGDYKVEKLNDLLVRILLENLN
ncbi:MAG: hypothetical protein GX899_03660 [Rikenellaceae bacterium]|nr:hypothetical protein [Rikenellaceae bacterium]